MPPPPITACLISGAEAARIGRALASLQGLVSEIVVVLNEEVCDGTEEICGSLGAVVHRESWKGHIAQKNSAAAKATQPWILALDADEQLSNPLRQEILRLFEHEAVPPGHAAYSFPRLSHFCGRWIRHGDWYPDRQTRLWRAGQATWGGTDPHDRLLVRGSTGRLRGDLLHYSNPTITSYLQKIAYFSEIHLQQQLASGAGWSAPAAVIRSLWRFFRAYVFRAGFLDGYPGFFIAFSTAYATLFRHTRLYEHRLPAGPPDPPPS